METTKDQKPTDPKSEAPKNRDWLQEAQQRLQEKKKKQRGDKK